MSRASATGETDRRAVAYSKGALFLDALRKALGEAQFWRGVAAYTRAHLGGVVTGGDLEEAMAAAAGTQMAATSVHALFTAWVYEPQGPQGKLMETRQETSP